MQLLLSAAMSVASASEGGGGFDPLSLSGGGAGLWTIIVFALSVPFIWIVVMGPVTSALVERDDAASRAITAAEKASAEAEAARAEVEVKLGEARSEAAQLMAAARERAEVREREIVEAAKTEAAGMLDTAREAIRAEQDKALSAIRSEVVNLSLSAAGQVLKRSVDSEDNRRLVTELVGSQEGAGA